jgi:hypothetical protein
MPALAATPHGEHGDIPLPQRSLHASADLGIELDNGCHGRPRLRVAPPRAEFLSQGAAGAAPTGSVEHDVERKLGGCARYAGNAGGVESGVIERQVNPSHGAEHAQMAGAKIQLDRSRAVDEQCLAGGLWHGKLPILGKT